MRLRLALSGIVAAVAAVASSRGMAEPVPPHAVPAVSAAGEAPVARRLDLSPSVMRAAIADADRDFAPSSSRGATFGTLRAAKQDRIDRQFQAAAVESCIGDGAYKFDPPTIGFIGFGGLLGLPWLVHAMATGRCRMSFEAPSSETVGVRTRIDERRDLAPVPLRRAPFS